MPCDKMIGTLICYAGSASEASIDSKPIGSELKSDMVTIPPICQDLLKPAVAPLCRSMARKGRKTR